MATKKVREPLTLHQHGQERASVDVNGDVKIDGDGPCYIGPADMDRLCKWWLGDAAMAATQPTWRDITVTPGAGGSVTIRFGDGGTSK